MFQFFGSRKTQKQIIDEAIAKVDRVENDQVLETARMVLASLIATRPVTKDMAAELAGVALVYAHELQAQHKRVRSARVLNMAWRTGSQAPGAV